MRGRGSDGLVQDEVGGAEGDDGIFRHEGKERVVIGGGAAQDVLAHEERGLFDLRVVGVADLLDITFQGLFFFAPLVIERSQPAMGIGHQPPGGIEREIFLKESLSVSLVLLVSRLGFPLNLLSLLLRQRPIGGAFLPPVSAGLSQFAPCRHEKRELRARAVGEFLADPVEPLLALLAIPKAKAQSAPQVEPMGAQFPGSLGGALLDLQRPLRALGRLFLRGIFVAVSGLNIEPVRMIHPPTNIIGNRCR